MGCRLVERLGFAIPDGLVEERLELLLGLMGEARLLLAHVALLLAELPLFATEELLLGTEPVLLSGGEALEFAEFALDLADPALQIVEFGGVEIALCLDLTDLGCGVLKVGEFMGEVGGGDVDLLGLARKGLLPGAEGLLFLAEVLLVATEGLHGGVEGFRLVDEGGILREVGLLTAAEVEKVAGGAFAKVAEGLVA